MPWISLSRPAGLSGVGGLAAATPAPRMTETTAKSSARRTTTPPWLTAWLGDVFQSVRVREGPQLLQRLVLDLPDALARDVERAPHLVERPRVLAVEPVPELEDAALAVRQRREDLPQRLLPHRDLGRLVGQRHVLVREEVPELRLLLVAHRLLERDRR